jgi:hypothetical protein
VKYESLVQTTSCWVGQDKQVEHKISVSMERAQSNLRTGPGWTYLLGLQGLAAQVCTYKCI